MSKLKPNSRKTTAAGIAFQGQAGDVRQNEDAALHTRARDIARRRLAMASDRRTRAIRAMAVALLEAEEEEES